MRILSRRIHPQLPIYRVQVHERQLAYVSGYARALEAAALDALEAALAGAPGADPACQALCRTLLERATNAERAWRALAEGRFEPTCLTLYLSNDCQLACRYCFAAPARAARSARAEAAKLSIAHVRSGAEWVAACCRRQGLPLTVAMHGGGEPTLHWELLQEAVAVTREVASRHAVAWWGYIATHGVLSPDKVQWLARHFDEVGLSCDGPPELHDAQRPSTHGAPTSAAVRRTARTLAAAGLPVTARATLTAGNGPRVPEVVRYLHEALGAAAIRVEPAYLNAACAGDDEVDAFAAAFWEARAWARARGVLVETSGVRIDEVHGPFCNTLRRVLQLVPGGAASACFVCTGAPTPAERALELAGAPAAGAAGTTEASYRPAPWRAADLQRRGLRRPARCHHCFNSHHCAGDCPAVCAVLASAEHGGGGARCRLNLQLGARLLLESAAGAAAPAS